VLEVIVTTALIVAVFSMVAAGFGGDGPGDEAKARATQSAVLDIALVELSKDGEFLLDGRYLDRHIPNVRVGPAASTDPSIASVAVHPTTGSLGVAVRDNADGGACWMASADVNGQVVYAVDDDTAVCSGTAAMSVTADPDQPDRGGDPTRPIEL
jgi:hypothetical protein